MSDRSKIWQIWNNMIRRVGNDPTYMDCEVCHEWLEFEPFYQWTVRQDWHGKFLDKDIIKPGNRLYAPELCCFVSREINNLIKGPYRKSSGRLPGVTPYRGRFVAQMRTTRDRSAHLGVFDTEAEANAAYAKAKCERLLAAASRQSDHRVQDGLIMHARMIKETVG